MMHHIYCIHRMLSGTSKITLIGRVTVQLQSKQAGSHILLLWRYIPMVKIFIMITMRELRNVHVYYVMSMLWDIEVTVRVYGWVT